LEPGTAAHTSVGFTYAEEGRLKLDVDGMLQTLLVIAIAVGIGTELNRLVAGWGFKLPDFVTALFAGIVLANVVPRLFRASHGQPGRRRSPWWRISRWGFSL